MCANLRRDQWISTLFFFFYLWIDGLEARLVFIHLEVELGGGDGQGASHHRGRSHQLSAGAQVYWACRDTHTHAGQSKQARRPFLSAGWLLPRSFFFVLKKKKSHRQVKGKLIKVNKGFH